MSSLSIARYFPFSRVRIQGQSVSSSGDLAVVDAEPDRRYLPRCHGCGQGCRRIHRWERRSIRDLSISAARVSLRVSYRKVACPGCRGVRVEDLELFEPYQRVTKRLARMIHELCKVLTVRDVAKHLGLDWKTVKSVDKAFLEEEFGKTDYEGLRVLAVDEIAIRKGASYMTVVLDFETGRVVWMGKDRKAETLLEFFGGMSLQQKEALEAIAMDMWDPYIKAVRQEVPHVKVVFDLFHVVSAFNKVIDKVRNQEYRKASQKDRQVIKGSKYLLLKNRQKIRKRKHREHLARLLKLNKTLFTLVLLKEMLKPIWRYRYRGWAQRRLREWCALARTLHHPLVSGIVRRLERYEYGILNHCDYPIHTSRLEGVNNTIKVIKRKAYGFHDERYFALKVMQAFPGTN